MTWKASLWGLGCSRVQEDLVGYQSVVIVHLSGVKCGIMPLRRVPPSNGLKSGRLGAGTGPKCRPNRVF